MNYFERRSGQFIPISAMVMFTIVVFMVSVVNIYKISRTKLKVQNLADAAALNLAAQQAQLYNVMADRNEWMNRMTANVPSPSDPNAPANVKDCSLFGRNQALIPPIACAENNLPPNSSSVNSRKVWNARGDPRTAKDGAIGYAMLVLTINRAQKLFERAYNSFLGDRTVGTGSASSTASNSNFEGLLKADIPELADDGIRLVAWNSGEPSMDTLQELASGDGSRFNSTRMRGLRFRVHHDIATRYRTNKGVEATTLGNLLFGRINYGPANKKNGPLYGQPFEPVGWMVPDTANQPTISVRTEDGATSDQIGVGVYVSKDVSIPVVGRIAVSARSKAYVVSTSGQVGDRGGGVPVFRPTYWVKLAN